MELRRSYFYLLSLGSSIGFRRQNIRKALSRIAKECGPLENTSTFIETEPVGGKAERRFINLACICYSQLPPETFIDTCLDIEKDLGRVRRDRWEDRIIDIDIILAKDEEGAHILRSTPSLSIPHPLYKERSFVLIPAAEVAGEWRDPETGISILDLLGQLASINP